MLYLGEEHLRAIGESWRDWVDRIKLAVRIMDQGDYAQPLKPYLRYGDPANRIIAMPAYIGGPVGTAGLKWIASFPGNLRLGLPRAHSVTILNDAVTGEPKAIINSPLVSAVRTAAVSGLMLREWLGLRLLDHAREEALGGLRIGIIGYGPIGRMHQFMCLSLFGEHIDHIMLYDIQGVKPRNQEADAYRERPKRKAVPIRVAGSWQELYRSCNVVITCTVSRERYIDMPPAPGTLLLDVSLRDYGLEALRGIRSVVVDDWTEVCRENTDIELLHREAGLTEERVATLRDIVCREAMAHLPAGEPLLFCPMGMAAFDIAIADWYVDRAEELGVGIKLQ
jgi:ornithine cyclodeaminase